MFVFFFLASAENGEILSVTHQNQAGKTP
uniref:Uncharacterized protein n=1 Tax=Rhizophora mucronata TaxID=61149 RepID=A0A2P2IN02_RHIMU